MQSDSCKKVDMVIRFHDWTEGYLHKLRAAV